MSRTSYNNKGNSRPESGKKDILKGNSIPVRFNPAIPKEKLVAAEEAVRKYFADQAKSK